MNFKTFGLTFIILSAFVLIAQTKTGNDNSIISLKAHQNDGHDKAWESRPYYFKSTWGINGSGKPEDGEIWFNSFPGETGSYKIRLKGILEQDGSAEFALKASTRTLYTGKFPYLKGKRDCDARGASSSIDLGEHKIVHGEKISIWARSVYECGKKGAYALWYSLEFLKN